MSCHGIIDRNDPSPHTPRSLTCRSGEADRGSGAATNAWGEKTREGGAAECEQGWEWTSSVGGSPPSGGSASRTWRLELVGQMGRLGQGLGKAKQHPTIHPLPPLTPLPISATSKSMVGLPDGSVRYKAVVKVMEYCVYCN